MFFDKYSSDTYRWLRILLPGYLLSEVGRLGVSRGTRDVPSREPLYAQSGPDIGPLAIITVINLSAHSRVFRGPQQPCQPYVAPSKDREGRGRRSLCCP